MSTRRTFCAFGAYAVNVIDPHAVVLMPLINGTELSEGLKPSRFMTLDLSQRLGNVDFDKAVLDTLGITNKGKPMTQQRQEYSQGNGMNVLTIGPAFPSPNLGGIYIDREIFFERVRPQLGPNGSGWPQPEHRAYELMSTAVQRQDGSIIRYHGFHATVVEVLEGARRKLRVKLSNRQVDVIVDMSSRDDCDDPSALVNDIVDPAPMAPKSVLLDASSIPDNDGGAVFLELALSATHDLRSPKEPIGGGG